MHPIDGAHGWGEPARESIKLSELHAGFVTHPLLVNFRRSQPSVLVVQCVNRITNREILGYEILVMNLKENNALTFKALGYRDK